MAGVVQHLEVALIHVAQDSKSAVCSGVRESEAALDKDPAGHVEVDGAA